MEQVILEGDNFGNDPKIIKVYFNQRKAKVVGTSGKKMYVIAPRLPGDTCTVWVVLGKDSIAYSKFFLYRKAVTVSTIIGTGDATFKQGNNLNEYSFKTSTITVDSAGNLFAMVVRPEGNGIYTNGSNMLKINEEDNEVVELFTPASYNHSAPIVWAGGKMYIINSSQNSISIIDPAEDWKITHRSPEIPLSEQVPSPQYRAGLAYHEPSNSFYYMCGLGYLVKTPLTTWQQTAVATIPRYFIPTDATPGMVFHPVKKDWLFMSITAGQDDLIHWTDGAGVKFSHSIAMIDVSKINPDSANKTVRKLNIDAPSGAGHMDGFLGMAQFNAPRQMCFDAEGNLYVADAGNHCIRKIYVNTEDPELSTIETVVGLPGRAGFMDGFVEKAQFRNPYGIFHINEILYIADEGNNRIRRVAIE
jgi:DNA-binding beta-propeller fold protein YncE